MAQYVNVEAEGSNWVDLSDLPEWVQTAHRSRIEGDKAEAARRRAADERKAAAAAAPKTDEAQFAAGAAEARKRLGRIRHSYFEEHERHPVDYSRVTNHGGTIYAPGDENALGQSGYA